MKNNLPKVYANRMSKRFNNTQDFFYSLDNNRFETSKLSFDELIKKINKIFSNPNHVYKSKVSITINGKEEEKIIVGKNNNSIFTLDGEVINLNDIWDIKKRS